MGFFLACGLGASRFRQMLIDGATLVVGSLALAALSLDCRREVAIVVDEPSAVGEAARLFGEVGGDRAADDWCRRRRRSGG